MPPSPRSSPRPPQVKPWSTMTARRKPSPNSPATNSSTLPRRTPVIVRTTGGPCTPTGYPAVHADYTPPPLALTIVLAELRQTITTESCHSVSKHRRRQHVVGDVDALEVVRMLPRVYWGGHRDPPAVDFLACRELIIDGPATAPCHADGELVRGFPARLTLKTTAVRCVTSRPGGVRSHESAAVVRRGRAPVRIQQPGAGNASPRRLLRRSRRVRAPDEKAAAERWLPWLSPESRHWLFGPGGGRLPGHGRAKTAILRGGRPVYGSVLDIPYPSRTFGAVTCFHVLEHLNSIGDARHAIAELERVTAPGGVFILVPDTPSAPHGTKTIAFGFTRSPVASSFAIAMLVHPALWRYAMRNHRRSSRGSGCWVRCLPRSRTGTARATGKASALPAPGPASGRR